MPNSRRKSNQVCARQRFRKIFLEQLEDRSLLAATITVNSVLDTNARDSVLTLREAILINNRTLSVASLTSAEAAQIGGTPTSTDADTIGFNIAGTGVHIISVTTQLPSLTDAAIIDGYTQPGAQPNTNAIDDPDPSKRGFNGTIQIELTNGNSAIEGLVLADGSTVRGLAVNRFIDNGINVGSNCVVEGDFVGTDPTGALNRGNSGSGVLVSGSNNRIGGTLPAARNVVSNNIYWGISLHIVGTGTGNVVQGNFVGTDASGTKRLGNGQTGIELQGATNNLIGGALAGARNVVSANGSLVHANGIDLFYSSNFNTVQGNFVGIDVTGSQPLGNTQVGIGVYSSGNNVIGGTTPQARNVISASQTSSGVSLSSSSGNTIQGNFIGTDASGKSALGNFLDGVDLFDLDSNNTVGGTTAGVGNVIAFNLANGVHVRNGSGSKNAILDNSIYSNAALGIELGGSTSTIGDGVTANDAGDADTGPNNLQNFPVISSATLTASRLSLSYLVNSATANSAYPLRVEFFKADSDGQEGQTFLGFDTYAATGAGTTKTVSFTSAAPIAVGDKIVATATDGAGNTSEFSVNATLQAGACSSVVVNTNDSGTGSLRDAIGCSNSTPGIDTIGFNIPGAGVKSIRPASALPAITDPVIIDGYSQPGTVQNSDISGFNGKLLIEVVVTAQSSDGTLLITAGGSTVRGLILNNASRAGIRILNSSNNVIEGNFIGTNATGTSAAANNYGVEISATTSSTSLTANNVIGGASPAARNLISGNSIGIRLGGFTSDGGTIQNTVIQGNFIGTNVSGTSAIGNGTGVSAEYGSTATMIGGSSVGQGNVVSGNQFDGIDIGGSSTSCGNGSIFTGKSTGNVVQGNKIGTDVTGTHALGNGANGITTGFFFNNFEATHLIGGTSPGDGNIIAFNGLHGIGLHDGLSSVLSNSIFSNAQLGIRFGAIGCSPRANDSGDADGGVNNLQNFPEFNSVSLTGNALSVQYAVSSATTSSSYPLRVEFFKADADGQEGQTFLGFDTYAATEATTFKTFSIVPAGALAVGDKIVATATDNAGNTSEFSPSQAVQGGGQNSPPTIISNGGGSMASISISENTTAVVDVDAIDPDAGTTLTYSISGGADAAKFVINATTGVLAFASAPNYESPTDSGTNNVYDVIVQASDGVLSDSQTLAVTVTNLNEVPVITSNGGGASASISLPENTLSVTDVDATDPDAGTALTYSISGGVDAGRFAINAVTGVLAFFSSPDYENPIDAGANNVYDVIVQVKDGAFSVKQTLAVTVSNVNESPVITSNSGGFSVSVSVPENTTAVTDVDATDPDAGTTLTYSISGGADAAKFAIIATTGVLTFTAAPNFEAPTDSGTNNVYDIIVRVSDGTLTDTQTIAVSITNVNEAPTITSNGGSAVANISMPENTAAVTDVDATDLDAGTTLTYSIVGGADAEKFFIDSTNGVLTFANAPNYENPTDSGTDNVYDVIVQAKDTALSASQTIAVTVSNVNEAPTITSDGADGSANLGVLENTTAVADVKATDPDAGQTLTYTILGGVDAAKFSIDSTNGALIFTSAPNYENPTDTDTNNIYEVVVGVSDGSLTDSQTLSVNVLNINEPPIGQDDNYHTSEDNLLNISPPGLLANDTDPDAGDVKSLVGVNGLEANVGKQIILTSGTLLTVNSDGSYQYNPNGAFEFLKPGENQSDYFSYTIADSQGVTSSATVTIQVNGENDAPIAADDRYSVNEDTLLTVGANGLVANDYDADGDKLMLAVKDQPRHGQLTLRLDKSFTYQPEQNFNGPDSFTYQLSDGQATSNVATVTISVKAVNDRPVVSLSGDLSIDEGTAFSSHGSFVDPDSGDAWTATVDYGDGTKQSLPLAADKTFSLGHAYRDNGLYTVTVAVQDSGPLTGTASFQVRANNVAPQQITWPGPAQALLGQNIIFAGVFSDPGLADTETASVDWGDGSTSAATVTGGNGVWQIRGSHAYFAGGFHSVVVTVKDDDGGLATKSAIIELVGAVLQGSTLQIVGAEQHDDLKLTTVNPALLVSGTLGSTSISQSFPLASVQRIMADLHGGDDSFTVDAKIKLPLLVNAGAGNDVVRAGGGTAVLIGGTGQDSLYGGPKTDLLIAGTTTYDANSTALVAILSEWSSSQSFPTRVKNLRTGAGSVLQGNGIKLVVGTTLLNDTSVDTLIGNGDFDWFMLDGKKDKIKVFIRGEQIN